MAQPFVYIFALILGALILIWGIKVIVDMVSIGGKAELGKITKTIQSDVEAYYNYDEGSTKELSISLPKGLSYLCISDPGKNFNCQKKDIAGVTKPCGSVGTLEPLLKREAEKADNKNNLFAIPFAQATLEGGKFKAPNLKPVSGINPICIQTGAKLVLTSRAGYVEAS